MKKLSVWAVYHFQAIVLLAFASLTIGGDPGGDAADADAPIRNPGMTASAKKSGREGLSNAARLREDHIDVLTYCDKLLASPGVADSMTQKICARMTILVDQAMEHLASVDQETLTLRAENQRLLSEMDTCQQNITALLHDTEDAKAYLALCVADSRVTSSKLSAMEEDLQSAQSQNQQLMGETEQWQREDVHVEYAKDTKTALLEKCQAELISAARDTRTCKKALMECTGVKEELWMRHDTCIVRAADTNSRNEKLEAENLGLLYEIERIKTAKHQFRGFPVWRLLRRLWRIVLPKRFGGVD